MNKKIKNINIQSIRGLAIIFVFLSHSFGMLFDVSINIFGYSLFTELAIWSVGYFFLLSGYFSYNKLKDFTIKNSINYVFRRVLRIYPVYIIVILLGFIWCYLQISWDQNLFAGLNEYWNNKVPIKDLINHMFLIKWFNTEIIDPPIWTLIVEMKMIFPMIFVVPLIKLFERFKKLIFLAVIIGGILLGTYIGYLHYFVLFLVGAFFYQATSQDDSRKVKKQVAIIILLIALILYYSSYFSNYYKGFTDEIRNAIKAIGLSMILYLVLRLREDSIVKRILSCKFFVFMGNISYEFYLIHFVILLGLRPIMSYINNIYVYILLAFIVSFISSVALFLLQNKLMKLSTKT